VKRARQSRRAPAVVGVDTGGTFTDFVARLPSGWVALKLPSTPSAPERAVLEGLAQFGSDRSTRVRHGSTVATNTLLERKGAKVVMVTNQGFEDLLEIGRQERPELYALAPRRVPPLVPRARRLGVRVRRGPDGRAWAPLAAAEIHRVVARAGRLRPEALVVGLLHSYAAPRDERRLGRALRRLGVPVTESAALCPEIREYERFATAVVNAYLEPRVARYIGALVAAVGPRLEIVLSHGGGVPARTAAREPVRQLLSGPAAGLGAAFRAARDAGFDAALTLDVGGTSTDVAFAHDRLPRRRAREVAGYPILLPMLDVHTVGAGGGSIAGIDDGGLLTVGPRSAGADPGPACYGRGGPATVTDAMVVLGRLPAASLGDGAIPIRPERARAVLASLAHELGVGSALEAARAVVTVANARMEAALRRVSVERGHDPRAAVLVAFGGAGGLHACELADALGASGVVFPAHAGVLSALGAALVPERYERSRSVMRPAAEAAAVRNEARRLARDVARRFTRSGPRTAMPSVLARYAGQSHELEIPLAGGDLERRFHEAHRRAYGFAREGEPVELVTLDVSGTVAADDGRRPRAPRSRGARPLRHTPALVDSVMRRVPVWSFEALGERDPVRGPAIVMQAGATLWVAPRWRGRLHASGALVLERGAR